MTPMLDLIILEQQQVREDLQGFIITERNRRSSLSLNSFLLELKVLFKDGSKTVPFEEADFFNKVFPIGGNIFQVKDKGDTITCGKGRNEII